MAFVEPVVLRDRGIELVPLGLEHEEGLRAAAADGELWRLRVTSVPEPDQTRRYIEDALQMLGRRRRAERRHSVGDAGLVQADDVHVALDHQQPLQAASCLACFVQPVKLAAFVEEFSLWRVQVLRFALIKHAAAESDRAAARVADREHDAVAEASFRR